jgi:3-hydroxybutyryl-CoA dehydrogenase
MGRRDMRAVPVDDKMTVVIKKVGVIGSGQMGNGIAHVAALAGFDVVLNDVSADRLKSAMATINGNLTGLPPAIS